MTEQEKIEALDDIEKVKIYLDYYIDETSLRSHIEIKKIVRDKIGNAIKPNYYKGDTQSHYYLEALDCEVVIPSKSQHKHIDNIPSFEQFNKKTEYKGFVRDIYQYVNHTNRFNNKEKYRYLTVEDLHVGKEIEYKSKYHGWIKNKISSPYDINTLWKGLIIDKQHVRVKI